MAKRWTSSSTTPASCRRLNRGVTADGFELKFGINVLGHYALNGLLLKQLQRSPASRVVSCPASCIAHRHIDFKDLQAEKKLRAAACLQPGQTGLPGAGDGTARACAQSRAANSRAGGASRRGTHRAWQCAAGKSTAACATMPRPPAFWVAMKWMSQPQGRGALPILHAAAASDVRSGMFFGPDGFGEMKGNPIEVKPSKPALDPELRQRLWSECARLTGVHYDLQPPA